MPENFRVFSSLKISIFRKKCLWIFISGKTWLNIFILETEPGHAQTAPYVPESLHTEIKVPENFHTET